jgi:arginyl-tRNA synthetase
MNTRSGKAKGRRLQNKIRDLLLEHFSDKLEPDDVKVAIMGESGEDIKLSPAARKLIPYSFECKNQEKLSIWSSLEQAAENSGDYPPVLIFKRNRSKTYVTIELDEFLKLIDDK